VHPYVLVPLLSCIASTGLASSILARDPRQSANQKAALLIGGAAWWAFCEVLWNTTSDPAVALRWIAASTLGFCALGPLCLNLFLDLESAPAPRLRRALPFLYATSVAWFGLALTTHWLHAEAVRTPWGFDYRFGPLYPVFYVFTVAGILTALGVAWTGLLSAGPKSERTQARALIVAMVACLVVASISDGLLPFLEIRMPHVGTAALASLGAVIAWGFRRFGYSLLAPGTFAREILQTLPDGVALLRMDGRIRTANGGLARLLGLGTETLAGKRLLERLSVPASRIFDEVTELECLAGQRDGQRIPVSVSSTLLRDKEGSAIGLVVVLRDLREVVALRTRLVSSARLAAVGELAAGVAHEINNPLTYVRTNLGLLRGHWVAVAQELEKAGAAERLAAVAAEAEELFDETLEGVDRAASFVRDVKSFSASSTAPRDRVNVNALLESALRVTAPSLRERVRVVCTHEEVPQVLASEAELKQVFLAMLLGAGQSLGDAATLRVRTGCEPGIVTVSLEADGEGLSASSLEALLQPGPGAVPDDASGLAVARQLTREHGGVFEIVRGPDAGARLVVRLPAAPRDPAGTPWDGSSWDDEGALDVG